MRAFFRYAAVAAALVVILLALVIVPSGSWDIATFVGLLLLASAVALPLALPRALTGYGKSETGSLAAAGTNTVILFGYLILSLITFVAAATGMARTYVWIFAILSGGWLTIGGSVSRGSVQYLNQTFPDRAPDAPTRFLMMAELSALRSNCPKEFADDIDRLLEKIRYAASDLLNDALLGLGLERNNSGLRRIPRSS
jgi:hypothetical protein